MNEKNAPKGFISIRQERINETVEAVHAGLDEGNIIFKTGNHVLADEEMNKLFGMIEGKRDDVLMAQEKENVANKIEDSSNADKKKEA